MKWNKVANSMAEIPFSSGLALVKINDKEICLVQSKGEIHACAAKCPHAGGTLSEGHVDALGNIVCPVHHYRFDPSTGRNITGEGYFLKRYSATILLRMESPKYSSLSLLVTV